MLNSLADIDTIKACDAIGGQTHHANLSDKKSDTGGLHAVLKIALGPRVMLTTNVDVSDGLVNGARGEVVHIVTDSSNSLMLVSKQFNVVHNYCLNYGNAVPLSKVETTFLAQGKRGFKITRLQFPLTLAWATTINKVQGLTLDEIVVDMKGGRQFSPGHSIRSFQ